jgi:hypothetical protein
LLDLPNFSKIEFQGLAKHTKDSIRGLGHCARFRQGARNGKLQSGTAAHRMTLDRVQERALEGG